MQLDVRLPMGLLFSILGIILCLHGFTSDPAIYQQHSLGINVNVSWGFVILAFGVFMLFLSRKKKQP